MQPQLDTDALVAALDQQRRDRGLSWAAVAREVGISPPALHRIVRRVGISNPSSDALIAFLRWLGTDRVTTFALPRTAPQLATSAPPAVHWHRHSETRIERGFRTDLTVSQPCTRDHIG